MLFHYLAADKTGKIIEGDTDAANLGQVLQYLSGKELRPMNVKAMEEKVSSLAIFSGSIKTSDKVFLTKYMALMLRVGTDLLSAINILIMDFDKPAMKNILLEVRENLTKGRPFFETFANHPRIFSPVFVNLVKAAEASGNLQKTFEDLSDSLQRDMELQNRVRAALVYPIILMIAASAIVTFLITFAIPKIADVFKQSGIQPPIFSRIVFGFGLFVNAHMVGILTTLAVLAGPGVWFFWKNDIGRKMMSRLVSNTPGIKSLYREIAIQRFASTFSSLMKAGLPIVQTTRITADVVAADEYKQALLRIADEGLSKGLTVGEAFRRETVFPRVVTNLVAISEKAGHLGEVLETLAVFYAANVDAKIRALVAIMEPLLLLAMGVVVGTIALAIIVPIYQLTSNF